MGIAKGAFKLLIEEAKKNNFKNKKILQLGRQFTFLTLAEALNCAKKANFSCQIPVNIKMSFNPDLKKANYIDDFTLFSLLGFKEIHSLDISSYENPSLIHDLNKPIPIEWHQQYDVVFDGGTLEHIFNVPQVFKNIHHFLKEGGIIIHASPSHNHVDHGFYMLSPTIFSDYYSANFYKILSSYIFEYKIETNHPWKLFKYTPGCLDALSFGGFGKNMLGIWFVSQKTRESTTEILPQQGAYRTRWSEKSTDSCNAGKPSAFKSWLKSFTLLRSAIIHIRRRRYLFTAKRLLKNTRILR